MRDIIENKILGRERLNHDESLWCMTEGKIDDLKNWAHSVRCTEHPCERVTYQVDGNINYTNVCVSGCRFCAFFRPPGHPDSRTLTINEILEQVDKIRESGGTGILMQGGHNPEIPFEYFTDLLKAIRARFPLIHIHAFSPPEISAFAGFYNKMTVEKILDKLIESGLDSLPGGGAEILSEPFRKSISPAKCSSREWLKIMRICHRMGLKSTATMVIGLGETVDDRMNHLISLRELQDETSGFTAFIPWTFQPLNTELEKEVTSLDSDDYLRLQACARLILDNIPHHQVSRLTQGMEIARKALHFGADDFSGVMMYEQVVKSAGAGFHADETEIRNAIESEGFTPVRRLTLYQNILHG
ncbi:MAG TPA: dehypoxanthine futalosine cyclase [Firmicutes bacterium]|mgnify:CR=1 FL=1|nr:dehypoxanthine futalosine cyclase [Bacillota bacterium]